MGPYCKFCGDRCFIPLPFKTPDYMASAYGNNTILATCSQGMQFEKKEIGFNYNDILEAIQEGV